VSFNFFFSGQKFYGLEKMNINGEHNDPSIVRSKLCFDMLDYLEVPASRANHVKLYINGVYFGLYMNVEHYDDEFTQSRFAGQGNLYKCTYGADLSHKGRNYMKPIPLVLCQVTNL
jgi:spore coat protein CotH